MAMRQSKPGLVVLNLEEMPMDSSESNPNQFSVAKLISQRFGGRKGSYQDQQSNGAGSKSAPRNSDKRSIGRDCSLVSIFTSNYALAEDSKLALQQLPLYKSLLTIEMTAITGSDRCDFAKAYLRQRLLDFPGLKKLEISTEDISTDETLLQKKAMLEVTTTAECKSKAIKLFNEAYTNFESHNHLKGMFMAKKHIL